MTVRKKLRAAIAGPEILIAPGVYDAFSAYRAEVAGFKGIFLSGSALAAMQLGRPDIGLLTLDEVAQITGRVTDRVSIPVFVDADQGFGNAYMAARTMQVLERAGASGIQMEDQMPSKPTADPLSRPLVSTAEMVSKIKSALDVRVDSDLILSARTDAVSTEGLDAALDRAAAYAEAGADMIFVENLKSRVDMELLVAMIDGKKPLLHNLLRANEEVQDAASLQAMGYSVALFPGNAVQAVGQGLDHAFAALSANPGISAGPAEPDRISAAEYLTSIQDPSKLHSL